MAAVDSKVLPCARWISPQLLGNPSLRTSFLGDTAYYTCGVKRGKCYGVVMCPANESFVGKTAALVSGESKRPKPRLSCHTRSMPVGNWTDWPLVQARITGVTFKSSSGTLVQREWHHHLAKRLAR